MSRQAGVPPEGLARERDRFRSREWTEGELKLLAAHAQRVAEESSPGGRPEPGWRNRFVELLKLHRPECPHTVRSLVEVETEYGIWGMEICAECGKQVALECPHVRCSWHHDGQLLICDNCGVDGT